MVLISISLMTIDVAHLFVCLFAVFVFGEMCVQFFCCFKLIVLFVYLLVRFEDSVLDIICQVCDVQMFSPFIGLFFSFSYQYLPKSRSS